MVTIQIQSSDRRIIRKLPKGKWELGELNSPILFKHFGAFEDWSIAMRNHDKCVLRDFLGLGADEFLFSPRNWKAYDDKAVRQIRQVKQHITKRIEDIEESIEAAKKLCRYDLVKTYEEELKDPKKKLKELEDTTDADLISQFKSRPLDGGDPIKKETNAIRSRKRRALGAMRDAGLVDEADDLDTCYDVDTRSVVFHSGESDYQWIVEDES